MKRMVVVLVVALTLFAMPLTVAAANEVSISVPVQSYSVNAGDTISIYVNLANTSSGAATNVRLSGEYGELELKQTNATGSALAAGSYYFTLEAPKDITPKTAFVTFTATYSSGGQSQTTSASTSVTITNTYIGETANQVVINNLRADDVEIGESVVVKGDVTNTSAFDIKNVEVSVKGASTEKKYVGKLAAGATSSFEVILSGYTASGYKMISATATFDDLLGKSHSTISKCEIEIAKSEPLSINDVQYPGMIYLGENTTFKFKLVNRGGRDYAGANVELYQGSTLLATTYVGKIGADSHTEVELSHVFTQKSTQQYKLVVKYIDSLGDQTAIKMLPLNILEASSLVIQNVIVPDDIAKDFVTNISFDILNKGEAKYSDVQAYISKDNKSLVRKYVGAIEGHSNTPVSISYAFTASGKYNVSITYTTAAKERKQIDREITVTVGKGSSAASGILKMQSVLPPVEPLISSNAELKFSLTNPSSETIVGAEAFVYDAAGNELNSIYISTLEPNKMSDFTLTFATPRYEGTYSYTIKVVYKDNKGKSESISKNTSIRVVAEKSNDENMRPAEIKIQKIEAAMTTYTNVNTKIPFTLVNAGKGTAYNVEIYVLDSEGNEIAREYIGTLDKASTTTEKFFNIKRVVTGEYTATLCVDYENHDETMGYVERDFSQNVIDYRASVTDISGLDWVQIGYPMTIEFGLQNSGTEKLLNTTAYLRDTNGTQYAELFIGTVEPGTKLERQKFKNVNFTTPGLINFEIYVEYENSDMQVFSFKGEKTGTVEEMVMPDMNPGMDNGIIYDENGNPIDPNAVDEGAKEGGMPVWGWILIGVGGLIIIGVVVLLIIKGKRKRKKQDDDDIDAFLNMMDGNNDVDTVGIEDFNAEADDVTVDKF